MTFKVIEDMVLRSHLDGIGRDGIDSYLLSRGRFRLAVLHGTWMVNQMRVNHDLGILESLILGHAYIAAGLMATGLSGNDRVSLQVACDGPVGGLHVECSALGEVRGYLNNSRIAIEEPLESFDTARFFGSGRLTVTRLTAGADGPFNGHIELHHGNLAQDLTRYYALSEQIPTAMALSVKFDREGLVSGAGGLLIQSLPVSRHYLVLDDEVSVLADSEDDGLEPQEFERAVERLENIVHRLPSLGALFAEGATQSKIVRSHFSELDPVYVGTRAVEFSCGCTRDRFQRFLAALPASELDDIKENGPFPLRLTCFNCNSEYAFTRDEIGALG